MLYEFSLTYALLNDGNRDDISFKNMFEGGDIIDLKDILNNLGLEYTLKLCIGIDNVYRIFFKNLNDFTLAKIILLRFEKPHGGRSQEELRKSWPTE